MIKRLILLFCLVVSLAWLGLSIKQSTKSSWHLFGKLPVMHDGRLKPMDSFARNSLLAIGGNLRYSYQNDKNKKDAHLRFVLDFLTQNKDANQEALVLVEHPQLFSVLSQDYYKQKYRVSYAFLNDNQSLFVPVAGLADKLEAQKRNPFQRAVVSVRNRWFLVKQLDNSFPLVLDESSYVKQLNVLRDFQNVSQNLLTEKSKLSNESIKTYSAYLRFVDIYRTRDAFSVFFPIFYQGKWHSLIKAQLLYTLPSDSIEKRSLEAQLSNWVGLLDAYKNNNPEGFERAIQKQLAFLSESNLSLEWRFNQANPFFKSIILYSLGLVVLLIGFFVKKSFMGPLRVGLFGSAFLMHSLGLIVRMFIEGRPPVTNLYSSAVFVGLAAVGMALLLEHFFKNKAGYVLAGLSGILSLIIAYHLSLSGDTLEMMRAVLDSNFWLSTHVIIITFGYSAVFVAGFLGVVFILTGFLSSFLTKTFAKQLTQACYASLAIALLFSTIGTILGGIWADQSWGRFWGWDPKENGAILIVLWVAITLHARLTGQIKEKGLMIMSIFGNIVCATSWFGVNMLGIGLHSYGFMDKAFIWLFAFYMSQVFVIVIGFIPEKYWKSRYTKEHSLENTKE